MNEANPIDPPGGLARKTCKPCQGGVAPMSPAQASELLGTLPGWELKGGQIARTYRFENYHQTMAFVNATAWVSHAENHHPDLTVGYDRCEVRYSTHSVGGLSENDFICAAKVDALMNENKS